MSINVNVVVATLTALNQLLFSQQSQLMCLLQFVGILPEEFIFSLRANFELPTSFNTYSTNFKVSLSVSELSNYSYSRTLNC